MASDEIKIVGFEKDLTLWVAETKGFFVFQGLTASFDQTRNSTEEISGLLDGKWDIAFDNGDNVIAWDEGQGADREPHDLFIFLGGSQELTQGLYVTPDIKEVRGLRGKILGVDAAATGYAVVLRYILQCHDLRDERDYSLEPVGSTRMRLSKLLEGKISGAMLNPRYVEEMNASSLRLLEQGKDYADPYPARVGIATRSWAKAHSALLVRFIKANIIAGDWILNSENRGEALELLTSGMGRASEQAEREYRRAVDPQNAFARRAAFDSSSLKTVMDLRLKTGLIKPPAPPLDKYFDDSFYKKASS